MSRDRDWRLLVQDPADRVAVVDAPVAHLRRVRLPPPELVLRDVVPIGPHRARAEPHVPIELRRRGRIGVLADPDRVHVADAIGPGDRDLADLARLHLLGQIRVHLPTTGGAGPPGRRDCTWAAASTILRPS